MTIHRQYLYQAYDAIAKGYPNLEIELYFVHVNGEVEAISINTIA